MNTRNVRSLKPGVILKQRYKIEEVIGAGGFGITYKAWDPILQTMVALKEYFPAGIAARREDEATVYIPVKNKQPEFQYGKLRFLKEAQDIARFQKEPNIVSIYDFLEENETAYLVMEYLHGCTLKEYIKEHGCLDMDFLMHISLSVADALHTVHAAGMIHRDISPENVFLCEDFTIRLIDFGAAKQVYLDHEQTMSVVLKPGYAPPEQYARRNKQGAWTDIYAFAATIYYAAVGKKPEEGIDRILDDTQALISRERTDIPATFSYVIAKAMNVAIENRYQSVEEMREALLHCGDWSEDTVYVIPKSKVSLRQRFRWQFIAGGVAAFLLVAVAVVLLFQSHRQTFPEQTLQAETPTDGAMDMAMETEPTLADATTEHTDSAMVMHVPTKEELEEQEQIKEVLNTISSETERVRIESFEYCKMANRGYQSENDALFQPYEGDSVMLTLQYYDSLKVSPSELFFDMNYSFTFERLDSEVNVYRAIVRPEWNEMDYAVQFQPELEFHENHMNVYLPLDACLEDGQYKLYFAYHDPESGELLFQVTIQFRLHRDV